MTAVIESRAPTPTSGATTLPPDWVAVCRLDDLVVERGAACLVDGHQIALFRVAADEVLAVGNKDPYCGANVIARGIIGTRHDRWFVASPMYKNRFCLTTGACLDDPQVRLPVHRARVDAGVVLVSRPVT